MFIQLAFSSVYLPVDQALNKYIVQIGFHLPKRSPIIYYDCLGNQLR